MAGAAAYAAVSGVNPQNYDQADAYDPNVQNTLIGTGVAIGGALLTFAAAKACRALRNRTVEINDSRQEGQERGQPKPPGEGMRIDGQPVPVEEDQIINGVKVTRLIDYAPRQKQLDSKASLPVGSPVQTLRVLVEGESGNA